MNEIINHAYAFCHQKVEAGATPDEIAAHICDGLIAKFGDGNPATEVGLRYIGLWIAENDAAHYGIDIEFDEPMDELMWAALHEYVESNIGPVVTS